MRLSMLQRSIAIVLLPGVVLAAAVVSGHAEAAAARTYEDPEDSRGNLDVLEIIGTRLKTTRGVVFRTTLVMQDEWVDRDANIELYYREMGARWPESCDDDCSGDYVGWIYYDREQGKIRATGYEPVNCDCMDMEWPVGRPDERSIWIDIPESYLYEGTHKFVIEFTARSKRQAEPALPLCLWVCRDDVGPLTFRTPRSK